MTERKTRYRLPQEGAVPDPEAEEAAVAGTPPPAAPGMAGESAPGEPSRAEIFAMEPELAGKDGTSDGTPTDPQGPVQGHPYVAGAPGMGKTEPVESAPVSERPAETSTPEERHQDMEPPKTPWGDPAPKPSGTG